ncbi:MAG TPA: type II CAAX endopeptidase family protein [Kofleriaceae bacterium]|nr:type II CAAX endopeptidase family protein [Kofleriaceae bacterium]
MFGPKSDPARVAGLTWLAVAILVTGLVRIDVTLPAIGHLGSALVAVLFLYAPVFVAWKRDEDLDDYGFHAAPIKRGLGTAAAAIAVIFPLFALGYFAFYEIACNSSLLAHLVPRNMCVHYGGLASVHPPALTLEFAEFCLVQLIVVALPEELFFRGFLLKLLEEKWPPKRRILGGGVGLALVLSAAAFALIHLPKDGDPRALATFFPALLFGWMRSATGSILASTVTHGASNILIRLLDLTVLR